MTKVYVDNGKEKFCAYIEQYSDEKWGWSIFRVDDSLQRKGPRSSVFMEENEDVCWNSAMQEIRALAEPDCEVVL